MCRCIHVRLNEDRPPMEKTASAVQTKTEIPISLYEDPFVAIHRHSFFFYLNQNYFFPVILESSNQALLWYWQCSSYFSSGGEFSFTNLSNCFVFSGWVYVLFRAKQKVEQDFLWIFFCTPSILFFFLANLDFTLIAFGWETSSFNGRCIFNR